MSNLVNNKHPIRTKLISNTIFIALEWIFTTVFSFLYWFIIGKSLFPDDLGKITIFINLTVMISAFLPLGTGYALNKLIPEYIGRNQLGKITSAIRFTLKLIMITTLITAAIIIASSNVISNILKIPQFLVFLLPISLFFYAIFNHQSNIMLGFQDTKKLAITSTIGIMLKVLITTVLIFFNIKFLGPIIGFIVSSFFMFLTRINYLFYNKNPIRINGKNILITFGLSALSLKIAFLLLNSSPALILALFHSPEVVGIFGVAMLLSSQLSIIPLIFSSALFPITSLLSIKRNNKKQQTYLINLILRYSLLVSIPILTFIILFSGKLIVFISQVSYLPGKPLIPILAFGSLLLGTSFIFIRSLYAIGKPEIQQNLMIFTSLVYIILSFPLTYLFSALGISIAYFISSLILFGAGFIYLRKILRFSIPFKNTIKLIFANIISLGVLFILSKFAPNITIGFLYTILTGVFYLFLLLFLRFYTKDDIILARGLIKYIPFGKKVITNIINSLSKFIEK